MGACRERGAWRCSTRLQHRRGCRPFLLSKPTTDDSDFAPTTSRKPTDHVERFFAVERLNQGPDSSRGDRVELHGTRSLVPCRSLRTEIAVLMTVHPMPGRKGVAVKRSRQHAV